VEDPNAYIQLVLQKVMPQGLENKQSFQMAYLATARITPDVTRRQPIICLAEYALPKSRADKISCPTREDCSIHSEKSTSLQSRSCFQH